MQHLSAFSRPQTVPAVPAPAAGRKPNLWILDSWRDLILYVCTPLLRVPMFVAAQGLWAAEDIYLFVAAFGAMGHHFPGMIRAYGGSRIISAFQMAIPAHRQGQRRSVSATRITRIVTNFRPINSWR